MPMLSAGLFGRDANGNDVHDGKIHDSSSYYIKKLEDKYESELAQLKAQVKDLKTQVERHARMCLACPYCNQDVEEEKEEDYPEIERGEHCPERSKCRHCLRTLRAHEQGFCEACSRLEGGMP